MRGLGGIFRMPGSRHPWIAYNHRGTEYRESAGEAIRESERKNRRKLTAEEARKVAENLLKQRLKETGADALGLEAFVGPQQDRLQHFSRCCRSYRSVIPIPRSGRGTCTCSYPSDGSAGLP